MEGLCTPRQQNLQKALRGLQEHALVQTMIKPAAIDDIQMPQVNHCIRRRKDAMLWNACHVQEYMRNCTLMEPAPNKNAE